MLKKFAVALGLFVGAVGIAYAANETITTFFSTSNPNPVLVQGSDGTNARPLVTSTTGVLATGGPAADDAAASGNPVPIGCKHNTTTNTVEDGDISYVNCNIAGAVFMSGFLNTGADAIANTQLSSLAVLNSTGLRPLATASFVSNGSTYDRDFTCPSSAVINVAAAATTQLVALQSSQIIRVCSFVISGDTAATTATFVYGTGANCATGQTALTGAMRMVDEGSISLTGMNGSLFRSATSNALCLTAATGAVTGFVTYAQY